MFRLRPVRESDHPALMEMAHEAGYGMTSLPRHTDIMEAKIAHAVDSFNGTPKHSNEEVFLFALEDTTTGRAVGCTGIKAHVGLRHPFYSYRISTLTAHSRDLGVNNRQQILTKVNDYTGATEIGSLYLKSDYRRDGMGRFLSRCRFLMLAQFPDLFDKTIIAEMRGMHDEQGETPFYDQTARHFLEMPFWEADYLHATKGGQFVADLMPKYPIYISLLSQAAQDSIAQAHPASVPAMRILEREGFHCEGYIDIFDGGPTLEAMRDRIRTVLESRCAMIRYVEDGYEQGPLWMVCTTELADMRMGLSRLRIHDDGRVGVPRRTAQELGLEPGMNLRFAMLD